MRCKTVLTRIDALRTGEIEANECEQVEEHLGRCSSCQESTDDVERFAEAVRSLSPRAGGLALRAIHERVFDAFDTVDVQDERVWVAFSARGIRMIDVLAGSAEEFAETYRRRYGRELRRDTLPPRERTAVVAAVRGEAVNRCAIDLSAVTPFERDVLETLAKIPRGEVRPYAWLAKASRHPRATRAIGNVMAHNPIPFLLPCHRVVPSSGGVGKYAYGQARKRALLEAEGVSTEGITALARRGIRYVGSKTTRIFCFPTCRDARRIRNENRIMFHDLHEARDSAFRPCKRCAPESKGG